MHCANCGKEVEAGKSFCTNCGAPVQTDAPPISWDLPEPPRRRRGPVILVVVLVLLIVAAAVVAAVLLVKDDGAGAVTTTAPGATTTVAGSEGPPTTAGPGGMTELVDLATRASDIHASSVLPDQGATTYEPANLVDNKVDTCWAEGVPGYGVGEYVEFTWAGPVNVSQVRIVPGYDKNTDGWDRWTSNGRVRTFDLVFSDGTTESFTVTDTKPPQVLDLGATHSVTWVRFVITGVYEASPGPHKAEDTSVSELHFWGTE